MAAAPLRYKISSSGQCPTATLSYIETGGHKFIIDEPVERGGSGQGATPLEVLVSSLIGCTNVISNRIAKQLDISIQSMTVAAEADVDARVLAGEHTEVAFPEVRLNVTVISDASPEQLEKLRIRLARTCPVSVLFQQAGTPIIQRWTVKPSVD